MKAAVYLWTSVLLLVLLHGMAEKVLRKAPRMILRISRQAGRYSGGNAYPVGQLGAYALRPGGGNSASAGGVGQAVFKKATRPGAYSVAVASGAGGGRPSYGTNLEANVVGGTGRQPPLASPYSGPAQGVRHQQGVVYRGAGGRFGPGVYQG